MGFPSHMYAAMRVYGRSYCYGCLQNAPADAGSVETLGFGICAHCRLPVVTGFDYFGERFQCLKCKRLFAIDTIRHRFEPQKDLSKEGIWCEECWTGTPPGSRTIQRAFEADPRVLPKGEDDSRVRDAVNHFAAYVEAIPTGKRRYRTEALARYRDELLQKVPQAERSFESSLNRLDRRVLAWKWESQRILLDAYIVDFYCERTKLIVEIDGDDHVIDPKLFYDQVRDAHLSRYGYRVIRFWNGSVLSGSLDREILGHVEHAYNERHAELHGRPAFYD